MLKVSIPVMDLRSTTTAGDTLKPHCRLCRQDMVSGTYCLVLRNRQCSTRVGALGVLDFSEGWHVYVGSAQGAAGLSRVARHIRVAGKGTASPRWHIDYLLVHPEFSLAAAVCAVTGDRESECAVARILGGVPVPGFGCSDCRCASHLFYFSSNPENDIISTLSSLGLSASIKTINKS
jgi:Uri superfamily endonuclease